MNMVNIISVEDFDEKLLKHLGTFMSAQDATKWLAGKIDVAYLFADKWQLDLIKPLHGGAMSACIQAVDDTGRKVVLKQSANPEVGWFEIQALKLWSGVGSPNVLKVNRKHCVLLMEFLEGTVNPYGFGEVAELATALHKQSINNKIKTPPLMVASVMKRLKWSEDKLASQESPLHPRIFGQAKTVLIKLLETQKEQVLLHCDLHANNLINTESGLKSIDPWVHVGDETFDTAFWVSLGDNNRDFEKIMEGARLFYKHGNDFNRFLCWTWAMSVLEHNASFPFFEKREQFIEQFKQETVRVSNNL